MLHVCVRICGFLLKRIRVGSIKSGSKLHCSAYSKGWDTILKRRTRGTERGRKNQRTCTTYNPTATVCVPVCYLRKLNQECFCWFSLTVKGKSHCGQPPPPTYPIPALHSVVATGIQHVCLKSLNPQTPSRPPYVFPSKPVCDCGIRVKTWCPFVETVMSLQCVCLSDQLN